MDRGTALDRVDSGVYAALDALGAAWITYQLYPNPAEQQPFVRAVDTLNAAPRGETIFVGPAVFVLAGEEYEAKRDGVEKLARRLFIHDIEFFVISGNATPAGLAELFAVAAGDDVDVKNQGGVLAMLAGADPAGIDLHPRGLLNLAPGEGDLDAEVVPLDQRLDELDLHDLARAAFSGASPVEIADAALPDDATDEEIAWAATEAFVAAYRELHETVVEGVADPDGSILQGLRLPTDDPYRTVRTYIESFFHLPQWMRINVLEEVLADTARAENQMFLDQFSGHDLAEMMPQLSAGSAEHLLDYAVEAAGDEAGHPMDLLAGLASSGEVEAARLAVAERVSDVLHSSDEVAPRLEVIKTEMEDPIDSPAMERATLRSLAECEDRQDRFQRVTRVWTARIARYIRDGDLSAAAALLGAVQDERTYGVDREGIVRTALERLTTPELLRSLAEEQSEDQVGAASALLAGLGRHVIDEVIIQLAVEEDRTVRRQLTDLLAIAARNEPAAIEPYLKDQRWYVVRNLVNALGHTANREAAKSVRLVLGHTDPRVRTEALRSMVTLLGDDAALTVVRGLSDSDPMVRQTASTLLRGRSFTDLDAALADELRGDKLPLDSAVAVVAILGERHKPAGTAVLGELAGRRFAFRSRARTVRTAARLALAASS